MIALYEATKAIYAIRNLDELLPSFATITLRMLQADDVSILLASEDGTYGVAAHSGGLDSAHKAGRNLILQNISGARLPKINIISEDSLRGIYSSFVSLLNFRGDLVGYVYVTRTQTLNSFILDDLQMEDILSLEMLEALENAQLYNTLNKRIKDLNEVNQTLEEIQNRMVQTEKLAVLGEIAGGVAHELNNPLTTILGLSDLLLESENKNSEKWQDLVAIKTQAMRCAEIITHLLQFSRRNKSENKRMVIHSIIEDVLKLVEYKLKSSGIELDKEFSSKLEPISIDAQQIQQVFLNVINNALQALEGRLAPKIVIRTEQLEKKIRIIFEDNGCGISKKNFPKIFDPFFTTKEAGKGTGLGLSISYGIVHNHQGDIWVESEEGQGTRFTIELPVDDENLVTTQVSEQ